MNRSVRAFVAWIAVTLSPAALAQSAEELQKIAANPIASTISTEIQFNFLNDIGESGDVMNSAVFQPVIPQSLNADWNLIHRPLVPLIFAPVIDQPSNVCPPSGCLPTEGVVGDDVFGLGDTTYQTFFSPARSTPIWGVGPAIRVPTHTDSRLGKDAVSLGADVVALWQLPKTTVGGLLVQLWSVTESSEDDKVNETLMQAFANHRLGNGWSLLTSPMFTANWEADSGNRWTVPLGGGFSKLVSGKTPIVYKLQAYYNVERPEGAASWYLQFSVQPMFPRK
jgi:hypothetical protein